MVNHFGAKTGGCFEVLQKVGTVIFAIIIAAVLWKCIIRPNFNSLIRTPILSHALSPIIAKTKPLGGLYRENYDQLLITDLSDDEKIRYRQVKPNGHYQDGIKFADIINDGQWRIFDKYMNSQVDLSLMTNFLAVVGKAVVWDMKFNRVEESHWDLNKRIRGGANDRVLTLFLILGRKQEDSGRRYRNGHVVYRECVEVAIVLWPDMKILGYRFARGLPDGNLDLAEHINALPSMTHELWDQRAAQQKRAEEQLERARQLENERLRMDEVKKQNELSYKEAQRKEREQQELERSRLLEANRLRMEEVKMAREQEKQEEQKKERELREQKLELTKKKQEQREKETRLKERQRQILDKRIVLELKGGGRIEGILDSIDENSVNVSKGKATITVHRMELSDHWRSQLWGND